MRIKTTILAGAALLALAGTLIATVPAGATTHHSDRPNAAACPPGAQHLASTLKRTTEVIEWREAGEEIIIAQPGLPALCLDLVPAGRPTSGSEGTVDVILENGRLTTEARCPAGYFLSDGVCYRIIGMTSGGGNKG
jgi:antitoxin (DNA-binding transcriptional repressor) of toxin-antitoxin stability system